MSERPIRFSAPMIRALLDGRKTMDRRLVSPSTCTVNGCRYSAKSAAWRCLKFDHAQVVRRPAMLTVPFQHPDARDWPWEDDPISYRVRPIVEPGDRLWVRETHWRFGYWRRNGKTQSGRQRWRFVGMDRVSPPMFLDAPPTGQFGRKSKRTQMGWWKRPSIQMPRWASRLTLVVTATKIERLQEISEDDALAEGCKAFGPAPGDPHEGVRIGGAADAFERLWSDLHGAGSWEQNPEVVCLAFTVHQCNIDQMKAAA